MTKEEIKSECSKLYETIKYSEERLKEIRSICKHEQTSNGLYSWRVGSIQEAIICDDCGQLIKYLPGVMLNGKEVEVLNKVIKKGRSDSPINL